MMASINTEPRCWPVVGSAVLAIERTSARRAIEHIGRGDRQLVSDRENIATLCLSMFRLGYDAFSTGIINEFDYAW